MQSQPNGTLGDVASSVRVGVDAQAIETAADALLYQLLDDVRAVDDLIGEHHNRSSRVALADARGRLQMIAEAMHALDELSPQGWHDAVAEWPQRTRVTIAIEQAAR